MPSTTASSSYRPAPATAPDEELLRLSDPAYADGANAPTPMTADAAQVAFGVFTQGDEDMPNSLDLSALWIFWGQFLDHDLSLSPEQEGPDAEKMKADPRFAVTRSDYVIDDAGVRQQKNAITPLIDASNVYGSDLTTQHALRSFDSGRMKVQERDDSPDLLPTSDQVWGDGGALFVAGDVRVNENAGLQSLHTLWVNEHNYWADRFASENPGMSDEEIFQRAKAVVETLIQKITYEEFLPPLLGDALGPYGGYDPTVDPQISNEFSTAAYRFGHTSIPETFTFLDESGAEVQPEKNLFEVFDNNDDLNALGAAPVLRGLLEERSQAIDTKVVDSLNFFLFTPDGGLSGFSLPERNILRGRDHGLDSYIAVREKVVGDIDAQALVGSPDFSIITSDETVQAELAAVYGTVDQVDLWVGGLAEDYVPGTTLGATFQAIQAEQFARLRDGDPYFYLSRSWDDPYLAEEILNTTLADVLMRSGGVDHVQSEAMLASNRIAGTEGQEVFAGFEFDFDTFRFVPATMTIGGDDVLRGTAERDLMIGFSGDDILRGRRGDDDLFGDEGDDALHGGGGADALFGGDGDDMLRGGGGADKLEGGDGDDVLTGGGGADHFVFKAGESGDDIVTDFQIGEDKIVLEGFRAEADDVQIDGFFFFTEIYVRDELVATLWNVDPGAFDKNDLQLIA